MTTGIASPAPRLRITRRSPSRTSMTFRSLLVINWISFCSRPTSIGLDAGADDDVAFPPLDPLLLPFGFFSSFKVAALEGLIEARKHLAAGVGDQDVVLDADAALAGQVDARLDGDDHARAELFLAADLAHAGELVDFAA